MMVIVLCVFKKPGTEGVFRTFTIEPTSLRMTVENNNLS